MKIVGRIFAVLGGALAGLVSLVTALFCLTQWRDSMYPQVLLAMGGYILASGVFYAILPIVIAFRRDE